MKYKLARFIQLSVAFLMLSVANVYADTLDNIIKSGTVKVGVSLFTPWTLQDSSKQLSGFEIDVANKLAQDMGVEAKYSIYEWDMLLDALEKGEIDVIAGGMSITPARALKVNFSLPYAESGLSLIAHSAKTKNINSLEKANQPEVNFAIVEGTVAHDLVSSLFSNATLKQYKTPEAAAEALVAGAVHALVASSPQPELLALEHPQTLDLPLDKPLVTYKAGLAVQKGQQEWLNFLNAWVTARSADKWLSATHDYWFESLEWRTESN
jgi:polar amino acid transport system substrate-binding protein